MGKRSSIYPDFLRSGLGKFHRDSAASSDLAGLLTALEQFQREVNERDSVAEILEVTDWYVGGLDLFESWSFQLMDPE